MSPYCRVVAPLCEDDASRWVIQQSTQTLQRVRRCEINLVEKHPFKLGLAFHIEREEYSVRLTICLVGLHRRVLPQRTQRLGLIHRKSFDVRISVRTPRMLSI